MLSSMFITRLVVEEGRLMASVVGVECRRWLVLNVVGGRRRCRVVVDVWQ
jgi:hypothetical protein